MTKNKSVLRYSVPLLIGISLLYSCTKSLTRINTVYFNDFENFNLNTIEVSGWLNGLFGPVSDIRITDYNGNKVLGRFNNARINLKLNNLPTHQALRVEFDLYLHDKWKNTLWKMSFDGFDQLLTGFSNDSMVKQAYPNWLGNSMPLSPAGADAFNTNLPGLCSLISSSRGTSMYKIVRSIAHSNKIFQLACSDAGGIHNDTCTRSWSMDNLKISVLKN